MALDPASSSSLESQQEMDKKRPHRPMQLPPPAPSAQAVVCGRPGLIHNTSASLQGGGQKQKEQQPTTTEKSHQGKQGFFAVRRARQSDLTFQNGA